MQVSARGQQGGQSTSFGGSTGQSGFGAAFCPNLQTPCAQRAMRVPHCPKSHVVPSGRRQVEPGPGSVFGQIDRSREASELPASIPAGDGSLSSVHAPNAAAAMAPIKSATAARAAGATRRRREREVTG